MVPALVKMELIVTFSRLQPDMISALLHVDSSLLLYSSSSSPDFPRLSFELIRTTGPDEDYCPILALAPGYKFSAPLHLDTSLLPLDDQIEQSYQTTHLLIEMNAGG
mmetsp:Transcript_4349/g.7601  ORF Transcript_4349/g.7601 Transcript_4349/m.7601 type:complete len:107 (-) Transcript_4349:752-1072(-)